jgi:uncharacterized tellurite resistance protein B-like protein
MRGRREGAEGSGFSADEQQVAEAALMFHVIAVDGTVTDAEREHLTKVLSAKYNLDSDQLQALLEEARRANDEAIDLFQFTRVLRVELSHEERLTLIANLWEMVFADGVVHEFEDNIVWRVAELLDVDTRDRMELKRQIGAKLADS